MKKIQAWPPLPDRERSIAAKAKMLKRDEFNWKEVGKRCESILRLIQEKDAVALKNAYRLLFEAIIVGDLDSDGNTELYFILRDQDDGRFPGNCNRRKEIRVERKMAQSRRMDATIVSSAASNQYIAVHDRKVI